jgi:hypothetical protein
MKLFCAADVDNLASLLDCFLVLIAFLCYFGGFYTTYTLRLF